jgi:N-acetylglucosamine-6-phosphate deacetylase
MNPQEYVLFNARLVLPREILEGGAIVVRRGRINTVLEAGAHLPRNLAHLDARGAYVTPGLIELHIHGAGGVGFDALGGSPTEGAASLARLRAFLRERGITTFVPTLVSREAELAALAAAVEEAGFSTADLPGLYVEGPFISPARRGGIPADAIRRPDPAAFARLVGLARGRLRLMTIAPELAGASGLYPAFADGGVVPCLGHSDCSLESIVLPEGRYSVTHLFNAMSPFSHRPGEDGLAMLPFIHDVPFVELNADGVHVNSAALRASARTLDPGHLVLISDATIAAGLPYGEYSYFGMRVLSGPDGVRHADTGVLMGSNRLAPDVLRNWMRQMGASPALAVSALSRVPARLLGIDDRRGAIVEGLDAVLVIWEGEFEGVRQVLGA